MLVFRLTEQEYDDIKAACSAKGGRNLSEFARSELLTSIDARPEGRLQGRLQEVDQKLSALNLKVQDMAQLLERLTKRRL